MLIRKYGNEKCDPEVEEFLQEIVSDFLTETITASCKLAMHRKGDLLELKDVQMYLGILFFRLIGIDKKYNISIPGYGVTQKDAAVSRTKAVAKSSAAQSHASRLQEVKDARIKGKGRR
jgi:transcription initiation factor TFIID subunit 12